MKPYLAVCHTPYQVLVEVCRAFGADPKPDLILSCSVPETEALADRLRATGLFGSVQLFDESACGSAIQAGLVRTLLFQKLMGVRNVEKYYGFSLSRHQYSHVYIHNDWSVLGRYLQDKNIPYILCEDTFSSTCSAAGHGIIDRQRAEPHFALLRRLGAGYLYWGDWKKVEAIETESLARCTLSPLQPLREDSKQQRFSSLTPQQKQTVLGVFLTQPLPQKAENAVLFLPRDFVADGLLTAEEQTAMFRAVVSAHCTDGPLFIKTHPRDKTDYQALFPNAVILQRTMPSEVLNFCLPFRFARAVTVESTVLKAFTAADEKLHLSLDEARALV